MAHFMLTGAANQTHGCMALSGQIPWWLDHVATPAILVLFGAVAGFGSGRINDWLNARKVKKGFLRAIRIELSTLRQHLEGTLKDATENRDDLVQKGTRKVLHLATSFQTGVYTCQLGKLRDVSDPLVLEIIRFYDQLSNLERVKNHAAARSFELGVLTGSNADKAREQPLAQAYISSLDEVIKRITQLLPEADSLINKLPQYAARTRANDKIKVWVWVIWAVLSAG